jgi:Mn2+/Fe2+ NRAMP family transporter
MGSYFQVGRSSRSFSTALVVAALLIAAALTVGVGQIKSGSIERAYRHTQYATGSVVSVGENRIAKIRYLWAGEPRMGELDVSAATGVDSGDRLALRVSDGGRRLQLETPFYAAVYTWTAVALTLIALVVVMSSWRSYSGAGLAGKQWLPAELRRPRRRYRVG